MATTHHTDTAKRIVKGTEPGTLARKDAVKAFQRAARIEALASELRRRAELLELTPLKPMEERESLESLERVVRDHTSGYGRRRIEELTRRMQETGLGLWHSAFELEGNGGRGCDCVACKDGRTDYLLELGRELIDERNNELDYATASHVEAREADIRYRVAYRAGRRYQFGASRLTLLGAVVAASKIDRAGFLAGLEANGVNTAEVRKTLKIS